MVKVGNPHFNSAGQPQRIIKENKETKQVLLDQDFGRVQVDFRHGYYEGIENRERFNDIMDQALEVGDPRDKLEFLIEKLEEVEEESSSSSENLAKYLRSEISHISTTFNIKPRTYSLPVDSL